MNDFKQFTFVAGLPPNGKYLVRLDEFEDVQNVDVIDGKAYVNSEHTLFHNFEWKKES